MKYEIEYKNVNLCPFCCEEAKLITDNYNTRVRCTSCSASGPTVRIPLLDNEPAYISGAKAEAKAIDLWNMIKGAGD